MHWYEIFYTISRYVNLKLCYRVISQYTDLLRKGKRVGCFCHMGYSIAKSKYFVRPEYDDKLQPTARTLIGRF